MILQYQRFDIYSKTFSYFYCIFFGGLECVGHFFACGGHFASLRDVWIRTQSCRSKQVRYQLTHPHLPSVIGSTMMSCPVIPLILFAVIIKLIANLNSVLL
jgi:hypothetical protein